MAEGPQALAPEASIMGVQTCGPSHCCAGRPVWPASLKSLLECQGENNGILSWSGCEHGLEKSGQCRFVPGSATYKLWDKYLVYTINKTSLLRGFSGKVYATRLAHSVWLRGRIQQIVIYRHCRWGCETITVKANFLWHGLIFGLNFYVDLIFLVQGGWCLLCLSFLAWTLLGKITEF